MESDDTSIWERVREESSHARLRHETTPLCSYDPIPACFRTPFTSAVYRSSECSNATDVILTIRTLHRCVEAGLVGAEEEKYNNN